MVVRWVFVVGFVFCFDDINFWGKRWDELGYERYERWWRRLHRTDFVLCTKGLQFEICTSAKIDKKTAADKQSKTHHISNTVKHNTAATKPFFVDDFNHDHWLRVSRNVIDCDAHCDLCEK